MFSSTVLNFKLFTMSNFDDYKWNIRSRDGVVSIATRYGLERLGVKSRWGQDFPHLSRLAPRPTQPPVQWVLGLSRG